MIQYYMNSIISHRSRKQKEKQKIIIVGNGWGSRGFLSKINRNKFDVSIVSNNQTFSYTPLLAQSINLNKNLPDTNLSIYQQFKNNLIYGEVIDFDNTDNTIKVIINNKTSNMKFDHLILSHGSDINTFNIDGFDNNKIYFLKSHQDMIKIRNNILNLPANSNIAIMGCGPTGIEIISSLIDLKLNKKHNIFAIDGMDRPVSYFNKELSNMITRLWKENNVHILMSNFVRKIINEEIICSKNSMNYDMGIWCGGIKNNILTNNILKKYNFEIKNLGIPVNNYLQVSYNNKIFNNIYAIGDCNSTNYPKTAQVAFQQGQYLANRFNSNNKINEPFEFKNFGQFCYIGNNKSIYSSPFYNGGGYVINLINNIVQTYNYYKTKF